MANKEASYRQNILGFQYGSLKKKEKFHEMILDVNFSNRPNPITESNQLAEPLVN